MTDIREAVEAVVLRLIEDPDAALITDTAAVATLGDALRVDVAGPARAVVTDMPAGLGGRGEAPTPGWLLRAAVASCAASTIAVEAARDGVDITRLEVTVDSDSDDRGFFGIDASVPAGPLVMRMAIRVDAAGDSERVRNAIARGVEQSPVCDAVTRAVDLLVDVEDG